MAEIRLAVRKKKTRDGLIDLLQSVFSDNDTNGLNGAEHISEEAIKYCRNHGILEDDWSDDLYLRHEAKMLPETMSEEDIYRWYKSHYSMGAAKERWEDATYQKDKNGIIEAVAYAYY